MEVQLLRYVVKVLVPTLSRGDVFVPDGLGRLERDGKSNRLML